MGGGRGDTKDCTGDGKLVVCATPIGNLGDISLRALDALREADVVCAEDTRVTGRLLKHFDIDTPLERCDENLIRSRSGALVARIAAGARIAYASDAGTPGVSDPGAVLVDAVREAGLEVEVIPGASAVLMALVASGFSSPAFYFGGFLPRKVGARTRLLQSLAALDATLVFYESPHRTLASLATIAEVFPEREAVLARELTKLHEEVLRLPTAELHKELSARETLKGEVVLLVGPPVQPASVRARALGLAPTTPVPPTSALNDVMDMDSASEDVLAQAHELLACGRLSRSQMARELSARTGLPRSEAYALIGSLRAQAHPERL